MGNDHSVLGNEISVLGNRFPKHLNDFPRYLNDFLKHKNRGKCRKSRVFIKISQKTTLHQLGYVIQTGVGGPSRTGEERLRWVGVKKKSQPQRGSSGENWGWH